MPNLTFKFDTKFIIPEARAIYGGGGVPISSSFF